MDKFEVKSTSLHSAICSDITIRDGDQVRLVFRPELVDNPSEPAACIKGRFLYQRKGKNDAWADFDTAPLSSLKKGEQFQLSLKSGELYELRKELAALHRLHRKEGVPVGLTQFVKVGNQLAALLDASENDLNDYLSENRGDAIKTLRRVLKWLSTSPQSAAHLADETAELPNLNALVGLANLRAAAAIWKSNGSNDDEEFWQNSFQKHSFVFSQMFAYPIVIIDGKAYVGGKRVDNRHGNVADFLARSAMTGEAVIIEIKTPMARLLGALYRDQVYPPHRDLTGAISQVLQYRETFLKDHHSILAGDSGGIVSTEPKCLVVVGCGERELVDDDRKRSFERFRERLTGVTVVTFDEVFKRVDGLIDLLETAPPSL
jgi:hypothetical protein